MSRTNLSARGSIVGLLLAALSLLAATLLFLNRQYVQDQITVWQYQPSAEIQTFVGRSGMNDAGAFYFYASRPSLEEAAAFNAKCDKKEATTAVLGCYDGQRIFVYNITDKRLDGIRTVTAAHEMLHAAYDRLPQSERENVNALLEKQYETLKNDDDFSERMKFYERTEPGQRDNELHSVIGTEVKNIAPELETYYRKFFADRSKVVALHEKYDAVFTQLKAKANGLTQRLDELSASIEADTARFNGDARQFEQDKNDFTRRANGGGFDSQAQFDGERAALLVRADELIDFRARIERDIRLYEQLAAELNQLSVQAADLNKSINSSLAPAPSL